MIKRFDLDFTTRKLAILETPQKPYSASQEYHPEMCQETGPKVKQATLEVVSYKQFPEAKAFS